MTDAVRRVIGEAADKREYETRTYTINARPDHLDKLETLFSWMNSTRGGHSGGAEVYIDGDGAARVTIERKDGDLYKPEKDVKPKCNGKTEFSVGLE